MTRTIVAALAALLALGALAETRNTVAAGGSLDAQGCAHPDGVDSTYALHLAYEYEDGDLEARASVADRPRGADCTEQGLTIDILISQSFPFVAGTELDLDIGYDEHGVTGFDSENGLVFGSVRQATAAASVAVSALGAELKAGWNLANGQPRIAFAYALGEHLEISGDCTGTDGDEPYCNARVAWSRGFGDGWGVEVSFEHANGFEHLPDPFGGRADAPAANESNSLRFSITRGF